MTLTLCRCDVYIVKLYQDRLKKDYYVDMEG
jgi:hypothetical protein